MTLEEKSIGGFRWNEFISEEEEIIVFRYEDVQEELIKEHNEFIKTIGMINGLNLNNKFNQSEVNKLLAKFQNKRIEIFGEICEE